jgi:hypothetical protein
MYRFGFSSKENDSSTKDVFVHYLVVPSEPKEVAAAGRGTFGFRNRYLAKRQVIRTIRRLRREQV